MDEESIFTEAREMGSDAERAAFLDKACRNNAKLRADVDELFRASDQASRFLESPILDLAATTDQRPISEQPGTVIGPYKLLQQIGEGGMGVVFMAEQTEPIQRTVALKIIKPGMDTRQVIARFQAERQAVAMMDHPNIAKVLDAGTTDSGRPYFVMELVKGVPITKYCDDKHLPIRHRLELFNDVCNAVQHAHQKGIIHRDIKPNNVLVAEYDDHAVPKVIDFGVAKATAQKLTERTMFTEFGQVLGTMEYMSPEQSKFNQLDIDTRSDIYSLGVLLYELLAGSTPFEGKRLKEAAFDEMLRIIREEEPPKPSTRLSSSETLPSIAANRHIEPARLSKDVRGELDWIVMKALEKDRNRRYETAGGFAADIERHLKDEPVEAGAPSAIYRFRKFARRNKAALISAAVVAAALLLGLVGTTWEAIRATHAERIAKSEAAISQAVNDFLDRDLLGQAHPYVPYDRYTQSRGELKLDTVLDRAAGNLDGRFADQPLVEAALRETIGSTYNLLGDANRAKPHLERAVELRRIHLGEEHPMTLESMAELGLVTDDPALCARVLEIRRRVLGNDDPDTRDSMFYLGMVLREKGEIARSITLLRDCVEAERRARGEDDPITAYTMHCLASTIMLNAGKPGVPAVDDRELESMFRHALKVTRKKRGDSWHTYNVTHGLAQFLSSRGRYDEAESLLESAISRLESLPGAPPEMLAGLTEELLAEYRARGEAKRVTETERKQPDAEALLSRVARLLREHPDSPTLLTSNAHLLLQLHRNAEAEAGFRAAASIKPNDPWLLQAIGDSCAAQRRFAEAEVAFREAIRLEPNESGRHHNLGDALKNLGKSDEAAAEYAEAERLQTSTEKKPTTTSQTNAK